MSWATRRRILYATGVVLFLLIVVGGPAFYIWDSSIPPTCAVGTERPSGVSSGPCPILDPNYLQPEGVLWTRAFSVRAGVSDAVAYIDNPNQSAGVLEAPYEIDLYDDQNALVQDVTGTTFIMPGGVTPIFVGNINTGNRTAVYAQFKFTGSLTWQSVTGFSQAISITNEQTSESASSSQVTALATNTSVANIPNITFVATVFDASGNAIATSQTALSGLAAGASQQIYFTWPTPFSSQIGSIDIIPVIAPQPEYSVQD